MNNWRRSVGTLSLAALLVGCGGGDSGGGSFVAAPAPTPTPAASPTPATVSSACTLRARQDWALATLREWYLFPDTLPDNTDPTPYATVPDYINALTATARSQRKDRYFTYLTSIASENAYYSAGSSAGFGVRLAYDQSGRVFVSEAFEDAPALAAGIDRGTEIVGIGTSAADLRTVSSIVASQGIAGITEALGPNTAGVTRLLRVRSGADTRDVTVSKADYSLAPVSSRYGVQILSDAGHRVGYVNLRTFISPAEAPLRAAFAQFRAMGITEVIVDLRYNGGGLVSVAELIGDLMGRARSTSEVWSYTTFRPEKSSNNSMRHFMTQPQSIAPTRVAFIGTGGTASASELVINGEVPYLHASAALIGTNTYGKPVGQIAIDRSECDDRLRVIAFATQNAARNGGYYDGLAGSVEASCQAGDDYAYQLGDPREASTRQALDFIEGKSCTPISTAAVAQSARSSSRRELLIPDQPDTAQRETPGLF